MDKKILIILGILLIGMISAEVCCEKKINGGWCVPAASESECDLNGYNFSPGTCDLASFCNTGCCYDSNIVTCAEGVIQSSCSGEGITWGATCAENNMCETGCCKLGRSTDWMTKRQCIIKSGELGEASPEFDSGIPEDQCVYSSEEQGACRFDYGSDQGGCDCVRTTQADCLSRGGIDFKIGELCSKGYPENTTCKPQDHLNCAIGEDLYGIYWFDSGNNRENVYEGNLRSEKERSYAGGLILSKNESKCTANGDDPDCGNCIYPEESICSPTNPGEQHVDAGDFTCKRVDCLDPYTNKKKENGESWCAYSSDIFGNGTDLVGSEYWLRSCEDGKIKNDLCGNHREGVCAEITDDSGKTQAVCRANTGYECFLATTLEECNQKIDCYAHQVYVNEEWNFYTCLPKFPIGLPFWNVEDTFSQKVDGICRLGGHWRVHFLLGTFSQTGENAVWVPVENTINGIKEANDICHSIADCGGYINTEGTYSKGYLTDDTPVEWKGELNNSYTFEEIAKEKGEAPTWSGLGGGELRDYLGWDPGVELYPKHMQTLPPKETTGSQPHAHFNCMVWKPQVTSDCSKCNDTARGIPCTEYKCKSLGSNCEVVAPPLYTGQTETSFDEKLCINKCDTLDDKSKDMPEVSAGRILDDLKYKFINEINNQEVTIAEKEGSEVEEGSYINFTLDTNVLAQCKYSLTPVTNLDFDKADKEFVASLEGEGAAEEHTFGVTMPAYETLDSDMIYKVYVLCKSSTCGMKTDSYEVKFKIKAQPDLSEPSISINPADPSYLPYGINTSLIDIIGTKQMKACRYSFLANTPYENMLNKIEPCDTEYSEEGGGFICSDEIKDLNDPVQNTIYVKCQSMRYINNTVDLAHNFVKTNSLLTINSISPIKGTIWKEWVNTTQPVPLSITTSGGAFDGLATCTWQVVGLGSPTDFLEGESTTHTASITEMNQNKTYTIKFSCKDTAENLVENSTEIIREIDLTPPTVVRLVREGGSVKITTDEEAMCYYDNSTTPGCGFILDSGIAMDTTYNIDHTFTKLDSVSTYYVKCRDLYQNENGNCAVIIRPTA
ncbi:Uncharacterised protein [uncultured archaeon]|nr:Uncharacterised protein [uncultured archaeon]